MKINEGQRGGGGPLSASLVDAISISNRMAKHRNAVSVPCRLQNVASSCNAGGSSSLLIRMKAAARLMQPPQCAATDLKTSTRFLQHASITQHTQALARQAQRTAQHAAAAAAPALFTRPRVTRSITTSAQPRVLCAICISAGAVASSWHAVATQRNKMSTRTHGEHSATTDPGGGSACCRR
jgi:hypothetical protein